MELLIRSMTKEDLPALAEMEKRCFSVPWSEQMLEDEIYNPFAVYFVAECDGKLVGYCGAHFILDEGHITNVAVLPEHRRKGTARRLLGHLENEARRQQISFLTLEVRESNEPARSLYASMGYKPVGVRKMYYSLPSEDAVLMTLSLEEQE